MPAAVPQTEEQPLLDLTDTFGPLNLSKAQGYALAREGRFPVALMRVGQRWKVRTVDLRRYLGLDD